MSSAVLGTSGLVCGEGGGHQESGMMSDTTSRHLVGCGEDTRGPAVHPCPRLPGSTFPRLWATRLHIHIFHFSVGVTLQVSVRRRWAVSCPMGSRCPAAIGPVLWPRWPLVLVPSFHDSQHILGTREPCDSIAPSWCQLPGPCLDCGWGSCPERTCSHPWALPRPVPTNKDCCPV